uniref:Uncharacterized protein n=1 Tax=viral metagenome TaxID=1070528 RepID=A0A6C0D1H3_9ZZZZ
MKIYVDGQSYNDLEYDTKQTRKYIYTNDGIYCYKKELQKMEMIEDIREKLYKNMHFYIDNSKINYTDIIYHIPYFHLSCEEEICKKNIGDGLFLVKINYFDQVDHYFETDRIDDSVYDAIITFLSSN